MLTLNSSIAEIPSIGKTIAKRLNYLGIETAEDLLFYFPFRYDDYSQKLSVSQLKPSINANIVGQVELIQNRRSFKRKMNITEALVTDDTGSLKVVWFNQPFLTKNLSVGDRVSLSGKVDYDYGGVVMKSPDYEKIKNDGAVHNQGFIPNYHLTAGLTQKQLRFFISKIIQFNQMVEDWLPESVRQNQKLLNFGQALKNIHFPKDVETAKKARERLAFNELFLSQLQSQIIKKENQNFRAVPIKFLEKETKELVDSLPFKLTDSQKRSAWEILKNMEKDKPMSRLLEGDVGSGKTLVAIIAMLNVALNKGQAVLMVPTEILARQHFNSVCKILKDFDVKIGLVTRSQKLLNGIPDSLNGIREAGSGKRDSLNSQEIIDEADIIIGTQALIQENINFKNLVLAIIDEQHRFGVEQRKKILEKSQLPVLSHAEGPNPESRIPLPHLLSMTATPIPRSLALALYGDLDISVINEMPTNRKKIITKVVPEDKRQLAYDFIRSEINNGRQVFVICPLIDVSDKMGVKSVKEEFEKLDKQIFPEIPTGLLHGKLKSKEKEEIMAKFLANEIKILVSTSVIEVGVDVPNASVMMIEGSDRFGLAQLHQFRGRVGRSEYQSYCFLFSESASPATYNRLQAMIKYNDGFRLAQEDLKFRGPGEIYGTAQKGFPEFKIASLFDYELIKKARAEAIALLEEDPNLTKHPALKKLSDHWNEEAHLE